MNSIWFQLSFCCVEIRHPIWFDHNICIEHSFFVSVMQGRKMDMNQFLQRPNGWQACDVWWSLGYNTELDSALVRCLYRALFFVSAREMNFCRLPPMARLPLFLFLFWKFQHSWVFHNVCQDGERQRRVSKSIDLRIQVQAFARYVHISAHFILSHF